MQNLRYYDLTVLLYISGDANTVLFQAELVQVKSDVKKELAGLRKVHKVEVQ